MKDHRPGLIADIEDGNTRTIYYQEPGLNGKPRVAVEVWDFLHQETIHRATYSEDDARALALRILIKTGGLPA
ncbi:hypothetical protein [Rhodococcus jostii]|uniref:hypothetical protein n=1 Tax=Rhodococcus jostii TaxID=132919 RepID=UPI003632354F